MLSCSDAVCFRSLNGSKGVAVMELSLLWREPERGVEEGDALRVQDVWRDVLGRREPRLRRSQKCLCTTKSKGAAS